MTDLSNKDKGEFTIVDPDNDDYEMHVDQYGVGYIQLYDSAGAVLIGQKASTASLPVTISSDQTAIPVTTTPSTPAGTTGIKTTGVTTVTKLGGTATTSYTIQSGEHVEFTVFRLGAYLPSNTAAPNNLKCELYHRPNGTGVTTGQTLIFTLYLQHSATANENFAEGEVEYTGDGTAVMDMVVTNWSQNDAEVFRQIRGYY